MNYWTKVDKELPRFDTDVLIYTDKSNCEFAQLINGLDGPRWLPLSQLVCLDDDEEVTYWIYKSDISGPIQDEFMDMKDMEEIDILAQLKQDDVVPVEQQPGMKIDKNEEK